MKEESPERNWEEKALAKIKRSDLLVVLTGTYTYRASGVKKEIKMAKDNKIPIVQIKPQGTNPERVQDAGVLYDWTWPNLKILLK